MGLASYGDPKRFRNGFRELVTLNGGGTYATPCLAKRNLHDELIRAFGPARVPGGPFEGRHADVAAAMQEALHQAVLHTLAYARRRPASLICALQEGCAELYR